MCTCLLGPLLSWHRSGSRAPSKAGRPQFQTQSGEFQKVARVPRSCVASITGLAPWTCETPVSLPIARPRHNWVPGDDCGHRSELTSGGSAYLAVPIGRLEGRPVRVLSIGQARATHNARDFLGAACPGNGASSGSAPERVVTPGGDDRGVLRVCSNDDAPSWRRQAVCQARYLRGTRTPSRHTWPSTWPRRDHPGWPGDHWLRRWPGVRPTHRARASTRAGRAGGHTGGWRQVHVCEGGAVGDERCRHLRRDGGPQKPTHRRGRGSLVASAAPCAGVSYRRPDGRKDGVPVRWPGCRPERRGR